MKDKLDKLLFDVKCSKMLIDACNLNGIKPCIYKTGASYTNKQMKEGNFIFGGEYSGHLFFRDKWPGFDDGIYAALRLIEMLSNIDFKLSDLTSKLNHYENEYIDYKIDVSKKDMIIAGLKDYADSKNYKYIDIDGIRVEFDDSFALVRASNTTPILTIRFEGKTLERKNELKEEFMTQIKKLENE